MRAVSRILQRSERQIDKDKIVRTFVDVGILPQLENLNNQILYGRRGTGKTHVLKVLKSRLEREEDSAAVVYIDSRTLGSTAQFSDSSIPIRTRCLALFRDILNPIHNVLIEHIIENPKNEDLAVRALDTADKLLSSIVEPVKLYEEDSVKTTESETQGAEFTGRFDISPSTSTDIGASFRSASQESQQIEKTYRVKSEDKVVFPAIHDFLSSTLRLAGIKLYILLDEWSSIPIDIQPYLAEFLKRGILPVQRATLKVATLEYRSRFSESQNGSFLGFELGADIATAPDLDDYYVYDRNPEQITSVFANIIYRHLMVDLPEGHLKQNYNVTCGDDLASRMFTQRKTFKELARAAEGVARDLINIFNNAFFSAQKRGRNTIDQKAVVEASRKWFEQDKAQDLDPKMQKVLRQIVDKVIGDKRARSFLLPRNLERHPMIQKLFDARVLHQMQRGYADKDNPGVRYNIYSLDYGTYVDLLGTSKEPQIELFESEKAEKGVVVPFNDKRSIRRIILNEDILEQQ